MIAPEQSADFWFMLGVLVLAGFLPSEIWRMAAAVLTRLVDEKSEIFVFVRLVATALIAAVVAKLVLMPPPALEPVPVWGRTLTLAIGILVHFWRNSVPLGVAAGVLAMVALAFAYGV